MEKMNDPCVDLKAILATAETMQKTNAIFESTQEMLFGPRVIQDKKEEPTHDKT